LSLARQRRQTARPRSLFSKVLSIVSVMQRIHVRRRIHGRRRIHVEL
jgi:hypothetical protein